MQQILLRNNDFVNSPYIEEINPGEYEHIARSAKVTDLFVSILPQNM